MSCRQVILLYLNEQTWIGEDGDRLATEVRRARQIGLDIQMVHEFDPAKDGCEFAKFFQTSAYPFIPQDPTLMPRLMRMSTQTCVCHARIPTCF